MWFMPVETYSLLRTDYGSLAKSGGAVLKITILRAFSLQKVIRR